MAVLVVLTLIFLCIIKDWALGVLHAKIIAAITLMGPQWWLKTVIEQVSGCGDCCLFMISVVLLCL